MTIHYEEEFLDYVLASSAKWGYVACAKMKMEIMLPERGGRTKEGKGAAPEPLPPLVLM